MEQQDYNRLINYYKESLETYGDHDARSVHWSDFQNQQIRFLILSQIANLNKQRVLDVGCGLGDLYKFFIHHHIDAVYTGIDIVPDFVQAAKKRFPEAKFNVQDIATLDEHFDYILASGALSFKMKDGEQYYFSLIKRMYDCAEKGVAFNMLRRGHHVDDETFVTYEPAAVADYCKSFCSNVQIVVDYLPQDFTVYLYK